MAGQGSTSSTRWSAPASYDTGVIPPNSPQWMHPHPRYANICMLGRAEELVGIAGEQERLVTWELDRTPVRIQMMDVMLVTAICDHWSMKNERRATELAWSEVCQ